MFTIFKKAMTASLLVLAGALVVLPNCGKCKNKDNACKENVCKKDKTKKVCPGCGRHKCICFGAHK